MTKIDLALQGAPVRTPIAKAARRDAKIWLCLGLMGLDAVALMAGFAVTLIIEAPRSISESLLTALLGALLVHAAIRGVSNALRKVDRSRGLLSAGWDRAHPGWPPSSGGRSFVASSHSW